MKKLIFLLLFLNSCVPQNVYYITDNRVVGLDLVNEERKLDLTKITYGSDMLYDGRFNIGIGSYVPMMYGYPNVAFTSFWKIKYDGKTIGNHPNLSVYLGCVFTKDTVENMWFKSYKYQYKDLIIEQNMYKLNKQKEIINYNDDGYYFKIVYNFYSLKPDTLRPIHFTYLLDYCLDANDNALSYNTEKYTYSLEYIDSVNYNNEYNNTDDDGLTTYFYSPNLSITSVDFQQAKDNMFYDKPIVKTKITDNASLLQTSFKLKEKHSVYFIYGIKDKSYINKETKEAYLSEVSHAVFSDTLANRTYYFEKSNQMYLSQKEIKTIKDYIQQNQIKYCYIEGYSDAKGDEVSNLMLSRNRAFNIEKQLKNNCKTNVKYYGESFANQSDSCVINGNYYDRKIKITFVK